MSLLTPKQMTLLAKSVVENYLERAGAVTTEEHAKALGSLTMLVLVTMEHRTGMTATRGMLNTMCDAVEEERRRRSQQ